MKMALVGALGGALVGCDGGGGGGNDAGTAPGTDAGEQPGTDGGGMPGTDGGGAGCGGWTHPADCPAEGVTVRGEICESMTWSCPLYLLDDRVWVVNGAVLTIDAGTEILGEAGAEGGSGLLVARGSRLEANGTAAAPIVFTSGNVEGARVTGDWAGVALLGSATTNDGSCVNDGNPATPECDAPGYLEDRIEGVEVADPRGRYGGTDDASSCGTLRYVRIEFAGAELSPDNELNGLTLGGCGSGTVLSHIQIHRGKDDAIEFFGGTASVDHLVLSGYGDDGFDCDEGWRGNVQFMIIHQYPGLGDNAIECDNLGSNEFAMPRTTPNVANFTIVGPGTTEGRVAVIREGMAGTFVNGIITSFRRPPDLRAAQVDLTTMWPSVLRWEHSYFFDLGGWEDESAAENDDDMGFDEQAAFEDAARNNRFDVNPMIGSASITAPNYRPGVALTGTTPSFGTTTATYAGAIPMTGDDWTAGWTAYPMN
ncbi:MAG: hypothetical protein KF729_15640 [Sandaracinaceae bacterium]|nr:hypothetical protein [Sandaracinaceae bacterium]